MYSNTFITSNYIVIDLTKEYSGSTPFVGEEHYSIVNMSGLSDDDFAQTYSDCLEKYHPFVIISRDMYEAIKEYSANSERERKRDALFNEPLTLELAETILIDELSSPVRICESKEILSILVDRILSLPDNQGSRMYKRYVLGLTTREISQQEHVAVDTVQKCLLEARSTIKPVFIKLGVISDD